MRLYPRLSESVADDSSRYDDDSKIARLRARVEELEGLLREAFEAEARPCRLDHHGSCQEHGWVRDDVGPQECLVRRARRAVGLEVEP